MSLATVKPTEGELVTMQQSNHNRPQRGQRRLSVTEILAADSIATINLSALETNRAAHPQSEIVTFYNVRRAIVGRALRRHRRSLLDEMDAGAGWSKSSSNGQAFASYRNRTAGRNGAR